MLYVCEYCGSTSFEVVPEIIRAWTEKEERKRPVPEGARDLGLTDTWTHHRFEVLQEASVKCARCGWRPAKLVLCDRCKRPVVPGEGRIVKVKVYSPGPYSYSYWSTADVHVRCGPPLCCLAGPSHQGPCSWPGRARASSRGCLIAVAIAVFCLLVAILQRWLQ